MSHVTDIILVINLDDDTIPGYDELGPSEVRELNKWLTQSNGYPSELKRFDKQKAGGNKVLQCDLYLAAFNSLDYEGFQKAFHSIAWYDEDGIQLMLKDEHEDRFTVIVPGDPIHVPIGR